MSDLMSQATSARFGAAIVALAPVVMLAGLFAHPYIATLPDEAAVAEAVAADTTYWGLVHLTAAVASSALRSVAICREDVGLLPRLRHYVGTDLLQPDCFRALTKAIAA